ncbi:MAG: hypothetical protein GEU81_17920 [Nitriliruptorales bacterium]|nr:hypothetical protein [Nitriliruptorales bacterium]
MIGRTDVELIDHLPPVLLLGLEMIEQPLNGRQLDTLLILMQPFWCTHTHPFRYEVLGAAVAEASPTHNYFRSAENSPG